MVEAPRWKVGGGAGFVVFIKRHCIVLDAFDKGLMRTTCSP